MAKVEAAEKEASEVLHSLLSVERIEKQESMMDSEDNSPTPHTFQSNSTPGSEVVGETQIQWHTPVSLFSTIDGNNQFNQTIDDPQVVVFDHLCMDYIYIPLKHYPLDILFQTKFQLHTSYFT